MLISMQNPENSDNISQDLKQHTLPVFQTYFQIDGKSLYREIHNQIKHDLHRLQ